MAPVGSHDSQDRTNIPRDQDTQQSAEVEPDRVWWLGFGLQAAGHLEIWWVGTPWKCYDGGDHQFDDTLWCFDDMFEIWTRNDKLWVATKNKETYRHVLYLGILEVF